MKANVTLFCLFFLMAGSVLGQTSAGKCWDIDYNLWNVNQPRLHIDCGTSDLFNTGAELTMEVWVKPYTFGENRKIMGKMDDQFNNGYVMGFQDLNIYSEFFTPTVQQIMYPGTGPLPPDSAFVHLASTYSAKDAKIYDYINGNKVGEGDLFPPDPIVASGSSFGIGSAPWDWYSFQFYGALDEIRIWSVARTESEIKMYMHRELKGDEPGLVAYYNFNTAHDSIIPDASLNGLQGVMKNGDDPCWTYADSYAPVGDEKMYEMMDLAAAWFGKAPDLFNYATTTTGLSVIAEIEATEFWKYVLFGHTGGTGVVNTFPPADSPADFQRLTREFYVNKGGALLADFYFNLTQAANGGTLLPTGDKDSLYVLMHRSQQDQNFTAIAYPNSVISDILQFQGVAVEGGYYCIGHGSSVIPITPGAIDDKQLEAVQFMPNPASERIQIKYGKNLTMTLMSVTGQTLIETTIPQESLSLPVQDLRPGLYFLRFSNGRKSVVHKLIIK